THTGNVNGTAEYVAEHQHEDHRLDRAEHDHFGHTAHSRDVAPRDRHRIAEGIPCSSGAAPAHPIDARLPGGRSAAHDFADARHAALSSFSSFSSFSSSSLARWPVSFKN